MSLACLLLADIESGSECNRGRVQRFLEGLLEAYAADVEAHNAERTVLLAAAAVELLRVHPLLADHAVALGAVDKLLRTLAANAPQGAPHHCSCLPASHSTFPSSSSSLSLLTQPSALWACHVIGPVCR